MSIGIDTAFGSFATNRSAAGNRERAARVTHTPGVPGPQIADAAWQPAGTTVAIARTSDDVDDTRRLRYRVLVHEQGKRLPGADRERRELADPLDDCATIWYAREGRTIVGTLSQTIIGPEFDLARLPPLELEGFPRSATYRLSYSGRFAIAATHRSRWVLPSLARHSYAYGRELGGKFDFMMTSPGFVPLFERFGYLRYTASAYHLWDDVGLLIPMVLPATDHAHLRRVRSPCVSATVYFREEPEWGAWLRASHPLIDVYYGSRSRSPEQAAALAEWLSIPDDVAHELSDTSFVHHFPAGTPMSRPGDRVTSTFLAVNAPLSVVGTDDDREATARRADAHCAGVARDGVLRSDGTIRCETDTIVLCVPDAALVRMARRYPEHGERLRDLFWHAAKDEQHAVRIFR